MSENNNINWRSSAQPHYVPANAIAEILGRHRSEIIDLVKSTYQAFYQGDAINPDTYSLKFPQKPNSRINALPAYVGQSVDLAGLKWVGSFPDNVPNNRLRASAIIILNSFETGYPVGLMDGTLISAARTAASAALAARLLIPSRTCDCIALIGAGVINRELTAYLLDDGWKFSELQVYDPNLESRQSFKQHFLDFNLPISDHDSKDGIYSAKLISMATTALEPWYDEELLPNQTILHISLRDIHPRRLKDPIRNVVDDVEHALKANTSLHLLQKCQGTINNVENYSGIIQGEMSGDRPTVVSAFGMGILDVAVANFVMTRAQQMGICRRIDGILPQMERWCSESSSKV